MKRAAHQSPRLRDALSFYDAVFEVRKDLNGFLPRIKKLHSEVLGARLLLLAQRVLGPKIQ